MRLGGDSAEAKSWCHSLRLFYANVERLEDGDVFSMSGCDAGAAKSVCEEVSFGSSRFFASKKDVSTKEMAPAVTRWGGV